MVTNGIALDDAALGMLRGHDLRLEISLDGKPEDHNRYKVPHEPGLDPYRATRRGLEAALRAGVPHTVVLVASPGNCRRLAANVRHVVEAGAREVEVNYALGVPWGTADSRRLLEGLGEVAEACGSRLRAGTLVLGNLRGRVEPALLNAELMADTDGGLHLMSEWMFETRPPCGAPVYRYGRVGGVRDINTLYWTRFHSYYTLLRLYDGAPEVRRVILDNIRMGERVAAHVAVLKAKVFGKDGEHGPVRTAGLRADSPALS
ncbi:MAG TPA: hypothetical protein DD417_17490 [Elusimicrobia bacterium]|nr:hypothetical protein [Elusimicrobiota bacterium]